MESLPTHSAARARTHEWIDARSLEMARRVAEKVRLHPHFVDRAKANIERWKIRSGRLSPSLREWATLLEELEVDDVLGVLTEDSERGRRLRQSSPFTGILTPAERRAIFDAYEALRT